MSFLASSAFYLLLAAACSPRLPSVVLLFASRLPSVLMHAMPGRARWGAAGGLTRQPGRRAGRGMQPAPGSRQRPWAATPGGVREGAGEGRSEGGGGVGRGLGTGRWTGDVGAWPGPHRGQRAVRAAEPPPCPQPPR